MKDIEIASSVDCMDIREVARKIGIDEKIECYGRDKAKVLFDQVETSSKGKLILVTAVSPTPYGEGKTTVSIGLNDGFRKLQKNSLAVLREPSLGPVFGIKGGACGGGYAQVIPMADINLHFTGDFHAITTANNLIAAAIDNHLYFGNALHIDPRRICFQRCLDMNDRALRKVQLASREESFCITAASEVMSVLCLSQDFMDLKHRLGQILIAYDVEGNPLYTKDLKLEGSLATILKDAIQPNLVQSLEHNPVLLHGGPFANVACGCNSIIATRLGLKLADYVVTEAGFGTDLGAEKFFDIKCRKGNFTPDAVVLVVTTKAMKYHGGILAEEISQESTEGIRKGLANLEAHIENMQKFTKNLVVTLNQYDTDTEEEIAVIRDFVLEKKVRFAVNHVYQDGGNGAIELAQEVMALCEKPNDFRLLYSDTDSITEKIECVARNIYHAKTVSYQEGVLEKIKKYEEMGYGNYPVCVAKTQYSLSDDPKKLGNPRGYEIHVRDVNIYTGAEFIVVYLGAIMTMPGLSKKPNYENIDIDAMGKIQGLF